MNAEIASICNRGLAALFNGAWQGWVVTALVLLILKLTVKTNAATRHAVVLVTLFAIAALPISHWFRGHERLNPGSHVPAAQPIAASVPPRAKKEAPAVKPAAPAAIAEVSVHTPGESAGGAPNEVAGASLDSLDIASSTAAEPVLAPASSPESALGGPAPIRLPQTASLVLMGLWIVLGTARLAHLGLQHRRLHCLKSGGKPPSAEMAVLFDTLRTELPLRRQVRLGLSEVKVAPMVLGFRRPMILLPMDLVTAIPPAQLEQVFRHELAHVRRYDDWANLAQQVIKAVLFFDPAVWWLCRRLTLEREIACDDEVLATTNSPRAYALFLTDFAGRTQGRLWSAAPAAWTQNSQLKERITMILNSRRNASPRLGRTRLAFWATGATLLAGLGLYLAPRIALAQEPPGPPSTSESKPSTTSIPPALAVSVPEAGNLALSEPAPIGAAPTIGTTEDPEKPSTPLPPAPTVSMGPKYKPQPTVVATTGVSVSGHPSVAMVTASRPHPVIAFNTEPNSLPEPTPPPKPPRVGASKGEAGDGELEARVERLERLVKTLLAREKGKAASAGQTPMGMSASKPSANASLDELQTQYQNLPSLKAQEAAQLDHAKAELDKAYVAQIKQQAKLEAERAIAEVKRATQQAQSADRAAQEMRRAVREQERLARREAASATAETEPFEAQRKELEAQRSALEKQLKAVAEQLALLERKWDQPRPKTKEKQKFDDGRRPETAPSSEPRDGNANEDIKPRK